MTMLTTEKNCEPYGMNVFAGIVDCARSIDKDYMHSENATILT